MKRVSKKAVLTVKSDDNFAEGIKEINNPALYKVLVSLYSSQKVLNLKLDSFKVTQGLIVRKINDLNKNLKV